MASSDRQTASPSAKAQRVDTPSIRYAPKGAKVEGSSLKANFAITSSRIAWSSMPNMKRTL